MKLFGRKKEEKGLPLAPPSPIIPQAPIAGQRKTLAQDLGLDKDLKKLPALPILPTRDSVPMAKRDLPTLPKSEELGDLPPLPSGPKPTAPEPLPPLPGESEAPAQPKAPVFIRLDKYNELLSTVDQMESRINDLQDIINKLGDIKQQENEIVSNCGQTASAAKEQVENVNTKLSETEQ